MESSRYPEAAFLAAVTASTTHEVRNVLSIIKESAGLVEDIVRLSRRRGVLDEEKVSRTVARIDAQVKRGADLLTHLNRLSHTLDHDRARVDLRQEVELALVLSQRLAAKKGQGTAMGPSRGQVLVTLSPLRLQMVLFAAVELCVDAAPEGASIVVEVWPGEDEDGGVVEFRGAREVAEEIEWPSDGDEWSRLANEARGWGARLEVSEGGEALRILFPQEAVG